MIEAVPAHMKTSTAHAKAYSVRHEGFTVIIPDPET